MDSAAAELAGSSLGCLRDGNGGPGSWPQMGPVAPRFSQPAYRGDGPCTAVGNRAKSSVISSRQRSSQRGALPERLRHAAGLPLAIGIGLRFAQFHFGHQQECRHRTPTPEVWSADQVLAARAAAGKRRRSRCRCYSNWRRQRSDDSPRSDRRRFPLLSATSTRATSGNQLS